MRRPTPAPSFPMTIPIGPVSFRSYIGVPSISAHTNHIPFSLSFSIVCPRFVTFATGVYASAPADAFATIAVSPTSRSLVMITPCAPARLAVRIIAPRLCGSSIPSSRKIKGSSPFSSAFLSISSTSAYAYAAATAITP